MKALSVSTIEFYQKHLSQHKGYTCAYLGLWQGLSCSEAVKRIIQNKGIIAGWPDIKQRFARCKQAYLILASAMEKPDDVSEERWNELTKKRGCARELVSCDSGPKGRCGFSSCDHLPF